MNRIETLFLKLQKNNDKALISFVTAGDPSLSTTKKMVLKIASSGADIIELGVPFSDPLADGPVIQKSALRSLERGTTLKKIIDLVKEIRRETQIPLVLMSSYNPIFVYGEEDFCRDAVEAGVDGVIVPDLPPEEAHSLKGFAEKNGLSTIFLLAPTSDIKRIEIISKIGSGFLYYVSMTGVTGAALTVLEEVRAKVREIKNVTEKPLCVGFGVSTPEQAKEIASFSDGVIVGSAIVKMVEEMGEDPRLVDRVGDFVKVLKTSISPVPQN